MLRDRSCDPCGVSEAQSPSAAGQYDPDNLLDRRSDPATLEVHYDQMRRREQTLLASRLPLAGGDVLSSILASSYSGSGASEAGM